MSGPLRSRQFTIPQQVLARLAAEEYVLHFWWLIGSIMLYGVWALFVIRQAELQVTGMIALAWPLTIPARAFLTTRKAARFFASGSHVEVHGKAIRFVSPTGDGLQLQIASVHKLVSRNGFLILKMRRMGFVAIPSDAFDDPADLDRFRGLFGAE